jgi:hypothetical protein
VICIWRWSIDEGGTAEYSGSYRGYDDHDDDEFEAGTWTNAMCV